MYVVIATPVILVAPVWQSPRTLGRTYSSGHHD